MSPESTPNVMIVGPSTRFISGITYYTYALTNALADVMPVSTVLLRRLLPARVYPGRARIGYELSDISIRRSVPVFDGVDWFWFPSVLRCLRFVRQQRPDVLLVQWWTSTVFHTYLLLFVVARRRGVRVVIEFHEVLDTAEQRLPVIRHYAQWMAQRLIARADAYVVHSEFDAALVADHLGVDRARTSVIAHAGYDHHRDAIERTPRADSEQAIRLLFFGTIRPYKGLEHLVSAFEALCDDEPGRYRLDVVGEVWEGWTLPIEMIERSPHRAAISLDARYVPDDEVASHFAAADVVVLPYLRSSQSGPLHVAMDARLPIVVTAVGGLVEAVAGYSAATLASPADPVDLRRAIEKAVDLIGSDVDSNVPTWTESAGRYEALIDALRVRP